MALWIYFDASALVKRFCSEQGSRLVNEVFRQIPYRRMICCILIFPEVVSILVRKRNDGRLKRGFFEQALVQLSNDVLSNIEISPVPVSNSLVLSSLGMLNKHNLNATYSILLRSVLNTRDLLREHGEDLLFLTSDTRLARAAGAEGIAVANPEVESLERLSRILQGGLR